MALFDYYSFQTKLAIEKINEETQFYKNSEYAGLPFINDYVTYLETRVGKQSKTNYKFNFTANRPVVKKMDMDEYAKDMQELAFARPWNKLKEVHRVMKITEFVDGLKYKSNSKNPDKNRQYLKDELIDGVKTKKFTKNKNVIEYDEANMCITSMDCVYYNKKKHKYEIEWE